jgi:hypothetical protein
VHHFRDSPFVIHMKRRGRWLSILVAVVVVLAGLRLALPWVLEYTINRQLEQLDSYTGWVGDVDLALWRAAGQVEGLVIRKRAAKNPEPFLTSEKIELSLEWESLWRGALVGRLVFWRPTVNLIEAADETQSQTGEELNWGESFTKLVPFRFNTIQVRDGTIRFRTPGIDTKDALTAHHLNGQVNNLTNVTASDESSFASFNFASRVFNAPMRLQGQADPTASQPTFDLNLTLREVNLTALNPWLEHYLNADAESGSFALYTEVAAAEGRFQGYAKPFVKNVTIYSPEQEASKGVLRSIWEATLEVAKEIFEDQPEEEIASRIPISGTIENPQPGILQTIINVLRNAFTGAFSRSLEHSVSLPEAENTEEAKKN